MLNGGETLVGREGRGHDGGVFGFSSLPHISVLSTLKAPVPLRIIYVEMI